MSKPKDAAAPAPQEILPPLANAKRDKAAGGSVAPERDPELEGLMSEIESDLREEALRKIWQRYGKLIAGVATVIVLAVVAFQLWRQHVTEQRIELSSRFAQAEKEANAGKIDDALAIYADVAKAKGEGYGTLAELQRAALLLKKNDIDGAIAAYKAVGADSKADHAYRDLASVLVVLHSLDRQDPKTLEPMLTPLTNPANPFHNIALELSAVLAGREGDYARAASLAEQVVADAATPQDMRARAEDLAAHFKAQAAGAAPATKPAAPAAPAPK